MAEERMRIPPHHGRSMRVAVALGALLLLSHGKLDRALAAPALGYYFIDGNTFTPAGNVSYARQVVGCVNQMPLNVAFRAPVHLPQGAIVKSITLFTYDGTANPATSVAHFGFNDGRGAGGYFLDAHSKPNVSGFQRNGSATARVPIDNKKNAYWVEWRKDSVSDSTLLSLCGVRIAYRLP
jgi:hypothetical protein